MIDAPLIQLCFVVDDIDAGMAFYSDTFGAGPWYVARHEGMAPSSSVYRGTPTPLHATIALGYAGDLMYEVVAPTPGHPSIFTEWVDRHGYGLHHFGFGVTDFDAVQQQLVDEGSELLFTDRTPRGARVAMVDGGPLMGGALREYIELTADGQAFYDTMRAAARQWDGRQLVAAGA